MKFRDAIKAYDVNISTIPSGYKRIGNIMILRHRLVLESRLGEVILKLYPWCEGVFQQLDTIGESREPVLRHIFGNANTVVTHKENGVTYVLDIAKITFSGGNRGLRVRLADEVQNGEKLLDMFAAVGNLSLQPLAKKRINAILVEKSKQTFHFLKQTMELNRINPILLNQDCRNLDLSNWADRIFMGYHDVDQTHLKTAIKAAKHKALIHLHPLVRRGKYEEMIDKYQSWLDDLNCRSKVDRVSKIKNYSPSVHHIEVVISINR